MFEGIFEMFDLDPAVLNAFVALIGVLLLVFAWRSVSSIPPVARWSLRIVLTAVIVAPFAALILLQPAMHEARTPMGPEGTTRGEYGESGQPSQPETEVGNRAEGNGAASGNGTSNKGTIRERVARGDSFDEMFGNNKTAVPVPRAPVPVGSGGLPGGDSAGAESEDTITSRSGNGSGPEVQENRSIIIGQAPPPVTNGSTMRGGPSSPSAPEPTTAAGPQEREARDAAAPRVDRSAETVSPAPAAAGSEDAKDWDVVPVYFGTDRARAPNDKRLDYGSERARKLELGRALVTVPKAHQVPQIERPWAITIPYFNYNIYQQKEDPKEHFTLDELKSLSEADLLALVKERLQKSARFKDHAFVFVHGYNTSFDFAIYRTAQIAYDIKFDGAPFVYSWPSGGGIASYTYDRESSAQAEPYFKQFLEMVTQKSGAKHVSIIAHSMGNQLVLRVLQDLQRIRPDGVEISQIIFAAPDVDRDSFETIASQLKGFATGGLTLYAAANDRALGVSRRFYGGVPRAGDVPAGGPLIMSGIDTIDATAVSMDSLGLHHSGYAESNTLLNDIGLLIQTGERPPSKRVPILQPVTTDKGTYWRYPGP